MLTSTLNLQVIEAITSLAFSSKLLNVASSKQRCCCRNCNTNTKASKLMTAVYLLVMLLCAMWLGPDNQDQPLGMGAVNQVLHTRIKKKNTNQQSKNTEDGKIIYLILSNIFIAKCSSQTFPMQWSGILWLKYYWVLEIFRHL